MKGIIRSLQYLFILVASTSTFGFEVDLKEWVFRSVDDPQLPMSLYNPSDKTMAIKIKIYERHFDINGKEDYSERYEDVTAFPENIILMPDSKEIVSLVWTNPTMPDAQVPLRLVVTQVPVKLDNEQSVDSVEVLFEIVKSLYITPPNAKPELTIEAFEYLPKPNALNITFNNTGNAALYAKFIHLKIDGQSLEVIPFKDTKANQGYLRRTNFLAGEQRNVTIALHPSFKPSSIKTVKLLKASEE